jgi:hypothetical protein
MIHTLEERVRMERVDLVVMNGQGGDSEAERMVDGARRAITLDLVDRALAIDAFASIIVSTNDPQLAEAVTSLPTVVVELDPPDEVFHFGRRLQALIAKHDLHRVVYMGGGSAPLLPSTTLNDMAVRIANADRLVLANNFYSVDFCAFVPASALLSMEPPEYDNRLGWALRKHASLPTKELARTAATLFDVDTPVDLMTLSLHPEVAPRTRAYLEGLNLDRSRIEAASGVFLDRQGEVLVGGRVSSRTMAYLEQETLCRSRVFSEERGMRSDGRLARGQVRSLMAMHMLSVGLDRFFGEVLPQLGQAAFLDDRVIWAHQKLWPGARDRFNSDLLCPEEIGDPFVRHFTEAAMSCPIPVVLGGHSLITGGLYVLVDAAWARSGIDMERWVEKETPPPS